jgi:hypothetical protein
MRRAGVARRWPGGAPATSLPCALGARRRAARAWQGSLTPPRRDGQPRTAPRRSAATVPATAARLQPAGRARSSALMSPPPETVWDVTGRRPRPAGAWGDNRGAPTGPRTAPRAEQKPPGGQPGRRPRRPASAPGGRRLLGRCRAWHPCPRGPTLRGAHGPTGHRASTHAAPQSDGRRGDSVCHDCRRRQQGPAARVA